MIGVDKEIVRKVYRQAANIILELNSLSFSAIGTLATTDDEQSTWSIKSPPWSITLHEAERNHGVQPQGTHLFVYGELRVLTAITHRRWRSLQKSERLAVLYF